MAQLENQFSWSKSRDEEFRECRRKYYYSRYLSWGGWDKSAPQRVRLAYVYKNLKNRWAWKGETVHHVIEEVLKSMRYSKAEARQDALKRLTDQMRSDYRASKAKKYMQDPKNCLGLFEHEYEKPITDETWKSIHDEAAGCLGSFYDSSLYKEFETDDKRTWLLIEDLEEFDYEGARIYVKLDFARKRGTCVEIIDWKTGKSEAPADVQMGTYAMYAMQKWNLPLESVRAYLMNLSQPQAVVKEQFLTQNLLDQTRQVITKSIAAMRTCLMDPVKNVPKPEEDFPFASNERSCDNCAFRKICAKYRTE